MGEGERREEDSNPGLTPEELRNLTADQAGKMFGADFTRDGSVDPYSLFDRITDTNNEGWMEQTGSETEEQQRASYEGIFNLLGWLLRGFRGK